MTTLNVHLYPSPITNESRMLKITNTLRTVGVFDEILIVGILTSGLAATEDLGDNRVILRIPRRIGRGKEGAVWKALKTLEWSIRVVRHFWSVNIDCVNCHSLAVLPIGVVLKLKHGSALIYDTHELETETNTMRGPVRILAKIAERCLVAAVDEIATVNDSIGRWYRCRYPGIPTSVVLNVPKRVVGAQGFKPGLRTKFGIGDGEIVFLYQGGLGNDRGIGLLLDVFASLPENRHLIVMGFGVNQARVEIAAAQNNNIHFHPAVPPGEVSRYTREADVGVHFIQNSCLNHYYCLPNKVFEYIEAGLPVLLSDFPEMRAIVQKYDCGWLCSPHVESVRKTILTIDRNAVEKKQECVDSVRSKFDWGNQESTILSIYKRLGFTTSLDS